ncbi:3-phosphoshikimate 1-carboxyvinyltransferase [Roseiconus nitratireducens]|uniref:3-phosphoshikimate 1-carboxyvinyltransferase n=1 Tax=Roseiconus nitratireducens TaxID=2605748 RepID=A0A5M6CXF2_9BACT|nr:3-phosphoshikimate 1-carboxyvinyltransferase [Roseiconus nitratireducens]KAA5539897.1 3-phosphoshikimate 1-carboxyvinyltransferase [Roseiconus nitratireducens]
MKSPSSAPETAVSAAVTVLPGGPVRGQIRPPGSKSLTNRALICAAMAEGVSELSGALRSEDTSVMIDSLRQCGVGIDVSEGGRSLRVEGRTGWNRDGARRDLYVANSGTTIRFLAAALSAAGGRYHLRGVQRMHERPISDLVDALSSVQKGTIECLSPGGCPPVEIDSRGWNANPIRVAGNVSSQYLSGLMMAAPIALADVAEAAESRPGQVQIDVVGELVSRPYVEMTAAVIRSFGGRIRIEDVGAEGTKSATTEGVSTRVIVDGDGYRGITYEIEPDASAASYFWAAAAITGGEVTVLGLTPQAMQGDVGFCQVMEQMGCRYESGPHGMTISGRAKRGIDVDMNQISDTVQTLAVVALFADGPTRVRGVAHNRFKETDRIGDLACELRKLGATVQEHDDGLTIVPPVGGVQPAVLATYHDHRMAMSLSLAGLVAEGVRVLDPSCTGKTYPEFFADLETLIGRPHRWG